MGKEESTIAKAKRQERQALIVSLNGLLALVLNVKDWSAWVK
jgi:hypothetical protein